MGSARGIAAGFTALLALGVEIPTAAGQEVFHFVEVADGIHASYVLEPHSPSQYAASLVVRNGDHLLVIDSRHSPEAARELIADIRSVSDLPVRYLVNTHWHGDHVYGNETFRTAFPGLRIIGHPSTAVAMESEGAERLRQERVDGAERLERWRRWLEQGSTDDGRALTAEDREQVERAIERASGQLDALAEMSLVPPDLLVHDVLVIHGAERTVRVFHPGPAHTGGDLVVQVEEDGVLAVGDLIEDGFPYVADGTVAGLADVLDALTDLPGAQLFGAHARALEDRSLLEDQAAFMRMLVDAVEDARAQGLSEDEAVEKIRMDAFRASFVEGHPEREAGYAEFVAGLVRQAWTEIAAAGPGVTRP